MWKLCVFCCLCCPVLWLCCAASSCCYLMKLHIGLPTGLQRCGRALPGVRRDAICGGGTPCQNRHLELCLRCLLACSFDYTCHCKLYKLITKLEITALLYTALVLAYIRYTLATVIEQRKLIRLIDNNLVTLHLITAVITSIVISYQRNC